jgi:ribosome-binding protein aMBF1 (putative translation factor)
LKIIAYDWCDICSRKFDKLISFSLVEGTTVYVCHICLKAAVKLLENK